MKIEEQIPSTTTTMDKLHKAVHILNGDALLHQLQAVLPNAEYIVTRECLIEGSTTNTSAEELFQLRASELGKMYGVSSDMYQRKTIDELQKIQSIAPDREIALWFENDLFCQSNLWFITTLLDHNKNHRVSRVYPDPNHSGWQTFSIQTLEDATRLFESRIIYRPEDLHTSHQLWSAFCSNDVQAIQTIARNSNPLFQHLDILAEIMEYRLKSNTTQSELAQKIQSLDSYPANNFQQIFSEFQSQHPMYGFGDSQLKRILDQLHS